MSDKRDLEVPRSASDYRFNLLAAQEPDAIAIVDPAGRSWTRGQVAGQANSLSRAMLARGVTRGQTMVLIAPNCAEFMIAYFAGVQIGMYVVPVNWHQLQSDFEYVINDCKAAVIVASARFRQSLADLTRRTATTPLCSVSLDDQIDGFLQLSEIVEAYDASPLPTIFWGRRLSYTSATTGRPKGVVRKLEDSEIAMNAPILRRVHEDKPGAAHLYASMLYHGAPLDSAAVSMHVGQVVVLMDIVTPDGILKLIDQHQVSVAYIVPTMFRRLLAIRATVGSRYSTKTLTRVVHTGAACPADVKRQMIDWWGPIFWEAYGATEGAGTAVSSEEWLMFPGTVGRPVRGTRLLILDDEGEQVPAGTTGTIYLTHYTGERFEYLGDESKTRECHRGEFFTVGDVGYVNEQGYLFVCDRKIDMINLSGTKVYSAEVEKVLIEHSLVEDCTIVGVPDSIFGEAIVAVIQLRAGSPGQDAARIEISTYLKQVLPALKLPKRILFRESLGREPTGKLQKRKLRDEILASTKSVASRPGLEGSS